MSAGLGHVEMDISGSRGVGERREQAACRVQAVGKERPDLAAVTASAGDAVSLDRAILDDRKRDVRRAQPVFQEGSPRSGKEPAIVVQDIRFRAYGTNVAVGFCRTVRRSDEADRPVDRRKTHAAVIGLLFDDTIEADRAVAEPRHAGIPDRLAMTLTAPVRPTDVETDEAEILAIGHCRNTGHHLAIDKGADEALWIRRMERHGIANTGIPALRCRPIDKDFYVFKCERSDRSAHWLIRRLQVRGRRISMRQDRALPAGLHRRHAWTSTGQARSGPRPA